MEMQAVSTAHAVDLAHEVLGNQIGVQAVAGHEDHRVGGRWQVAQPGDRRRRHRFGEAAAHLVGVGDQPALAERHVERRVLEERDVLGVVSNGGAEAAEKLQGARPLVQHHGGTAGVIEAQDMPWRLARHHFNEDQEVAPAPLVEHAGEDRVAQPAAVAGNRRPVIHHLDEFLPPSQQDGAAPQHRTGRPVRRIAREFGGSGGAGLSKGGAVRDHSRTARDRRRNGGARRPAIPVKRRHPCSRCGSDAAGHR